MQRKCGSNILGKSIRQTFVSQFAACKSFIIPTKYCNGIIGQNCISCRNIVFCCCCFRPNFFLLRTDLDRRKEQNHRHLDKQTDCWHGLPAYTANLLHRLSTAKNGATYPPISNRGTEQKNCTGRDKSSPSLLFFVMSWSLAPLFIICGQMVKLKPFSCLVNQMSMNKIYSFW